jgi:hypothetical protein
VRGGFDVDALLGGLGQGRGVVGHPQCVPGVNGAADQRDVGACDVHGPVFLVDPVHLGVGAPALEGCAAQVAAELQVDPAPAVEGLVLLRRQINK